MQLPRSGAFACVAAVAAFAGQIPGLARAWIWDDELLLRATDLYTNPARWAESLTKPLGAETMYWRPIPTTSFLLGAMAHGVDALAYRATSAVIHAFAAAILFLLAERLVRSSVADSKGAESKGVARAVALGVALLWGLHPVHMEAATWISGRFDLLAGLFAALALLAVPRGGAVSRGRLLAVGAATCAACLSKENAVLLPVLALLWAGALALAEARNAPGTRSLGRRRALAAAGPLAVASAAGVALAIFLRFEAAGLLFGVKATTVGETGLERALVVGRAAAAYGGVLAAPWTNVGPAHHASRPVGTSDPVAWAGLLLLVLSAVAAIWALRTRPVRAFLGAAFLVCLGPVLQVVPIDLAGELVATDRYVYLPSIIGALLLADVVAGFAAGARTRGRALAAAAGIVAASFVAVRCVDLPRWNDPVRFWTWASEMAPTSGFVRVSLGNALRRSGDLVGAEREARQVVVIHPRLLAEVLIDTGRIPEALQVLDVAVTTGRADGDARLFRGETRARVGDVEGAASDAAAVLALPDDEVHSFQPLRPTALALSALAREWSGDPIAAHALLADAERRARPDDTRAWLAIAAAAAQGADVERTVAAVAKARTGGADEIAMRTLVADALGAAGRHAESAAEFGAILALAPPAPVVFLDRMGYELFDAGDAVGAEQALRQAIAADPGFVRARYHLAFLLGKTKRAAEAREELIQIEAQLVLRPDPVIAQGLPSLRKLLGE